MSSQEKTLSQNTEANDRQVGGSHYGVGTEGEQHWDRVARLKLDYFQAQITKYVERCWKKNGIQDLEKARHFLDKYIELNEPRASAVQTRVKPTGWEGFTFEGAVGPVTELFTCKKCGEQVCTAPGGDPFEAHGSCKEKVSADNS